MRVATIVMLNTSLSLHAVVLLSSPQLKHSPPSCCAAGIPGSVEFAPGTGGLPSVVLKHACGASAQVRQAGRQKDSCSQAQSFCAGSPSQSLSLMCAPKVFVPQKLHHRRALAAHSQQHV